jgi:hypothetical protein
MGKCPVEGNICGDTDGQPLDENFALHTVSQTENLPVHGPGRSNCERILALVFERMGKFSESYGDAWIAVKRSNPALFTNF